jgi:hypothetical protein
MPSPTSAALFRVNGSTIADVMSASANISRQMIETTALGATFRDHEHGFLEGTVDCEVFFDASHDTILNGLKNGTALTAVEIVWGTGLSVAGNAKVAGWTLSVAPNGVAMATFSLVFSGSTITIDNT